MDRFIFDKLVEQMRSIWSTADFPPDYVLLNDLDTLQDFKMAERKRWLKKAKREFLRRVVEEMVEEISTAAAMGESSMVETMLEAFPEDLKNIQGLSEKLQLAWIKKANLAALGRWDAPGSKVYFVSGDDQFIKIGFTTDLKKRIASLNTASPRALRVRLVLDGSLELEQELHTKFSRYRANGEWFHFSEEIRQYIEDNSLDEI